MFKREQSNTVATYDGYSNKSENVFNYAAVPCYVLGAALDWEEECEL